MRQHCSFKIVAEIIAATCAMVLATSGCALKQPDQKLQYAFCHSNSECVAPRVCNKDVGYWRPPETPADAGVCIAVATASCPPGYVMTGGYNPHRGWNTSFCVAGPTYCHSDQECVPPDKCDKHTETFIPKSAGPDAGVCLAGN